jgi:hypothetical protein
MPKWFRRLAEIPGVQYNTPQGINRLHLPDHNLVPELHSYDFDGRRHESLYWQTREGSTSASPAHSWQTKSRPGESSAQTALRQLYETLELPGEPSDYHFAIQNCNETLWKYRREEPWVVEHIEWFCWLDIQLLEACPEAITFDREGEIQYANVLAFYRLISLYEKEGYLTEALEVARRAVRFNQSQPDFESLQERIAQLEAENGI